MRSMMGLWWTEVEHLPLQPCLHLLSLSAVQLQPCLLLLPLPQSLLMLVQLSSRSFFGFNHLAFSTLSGRKEGMVDCCCCRVCAVPGDFGFDVRFCGSEIR